jgi:flagellar biosynthesis regulator FlaF
MSTEPSNTRKRMPTAEVPATVVSSDNQSNSKSRKVSTDASALTVASHHTNANPASTIAAPAWSMESIGALIQDLFHSDNAKVNAALFALRLDLDEDEKKCDKIQAVGGCFALVHLE